MKTHEYRIALVDKPTCREYDPDSPPRRIFTELRIVTEPSGWDVHALVNKTASEYYKKYMRKPDTILVSPIDYLYLVGEFAYQSRSDYGVFVKINQVNVGSFSLRPVVVPSFARCEMVATNSNQFEQATEALAIGDTP